MQVSASTNPPKEENLLDYVKLVTKSGVDFIHCDVMDGVLVEAKTYDYSFLPQIKKSTSLPLDVHIMVHNPKQVYKKYITNGANILSVHFECFKREQELINVLKDIKNLGCIPSIAVEISTPIEKVFSVLKYCQNVLLMSVKIGKSGQKFDDLVLSKVQKLKKFVDDNNLNITIEVDGGVNAQNIKQLENLGVSCVVVGGYLFNAQDKIDAVSRLKNNT